MRPSAARKPGPRPLDLVERTNGPKAAPALKQVPSRDVAESLRESLRKFPSPARPSQAPDEPSRRPPSPGRGPRVCAFPLSGGGRVEIHARHQLIHLGMDSMEACIGLLDLLHSGEINQITEGNGHTLAPDLRNSISGVTLVIEIRNLDGPERSETSSPPLPNPAAPPSPRQGLGFPTV